MKMGKLKKRTLLLFAIFLMILFDTNIFFTYFITRIYIIFPLFITIFGFLILEKKLFWKIQREIPFTNMYVVLTLSSYIIVFLATKVLFPQQSLYQTFNTENRTFCLFFILLVYPLIGLFYKDGGARKLFKLLNICALLIYIIEMIQVLFVQTKGISLFHGFNSIDEVSYRLGSIRIIMHWIGNVMIIYNFYKFYCLMENRIKHFMMTILGLVVAIFISQSRLYLIAIVICLLFIVLFEKSTKKIFLKKCSVVLFIVIFCFATDYLAQFISTFSKRGSLSYSTNARLYAYSYYWNYFIDHPFVGFGFANFLLYYSVIHGNGMAFLDDVGIVGQLANLGFFIIPIYVIPMIRLGYISIKMYRKKVEHALLLLSFWIYLIITSAAQIVIDQNRILFWPIVIAIFEYSYFQFKNKQKINI